MKPTRRQRITRFWVAGLETRAGAQQFQSEVGGPCGGRSGRRLIEPAQVSKATYFNETPPPHFDRDGDGWSRRSINLCSES